MEPENSARDDASGPSSPFAAMHDFFSHPQQALASWGRLAREQIDRVEKLSADLDKLSAQGRARMEDAAHEVANLFKASLQYSASLGEAARSLSMQTARQSLDLIAPAKD